MVDSKFEYSPDIGFLSMTVKGHAGFAELGKDPVCAGASTLAMTVAQCIECMHEDGKLQKKPTVLIRNGRITVTAKPKPEYFAEAFHVFYIGEVGMQLLSESYPENASITPFVLPEKG